MCPIAYVNEISSSYRALCERRLANDNLYEEEDNVNAYEDFDSGLLINSHAERCYPDEGCGANCCSDTMLEGKERRQVSYRPWRKVMSGWVYSGCLRAGACETSLF